MTAPGYGAPTAMGHYPHDCEEALPVCASCGHASGRYGAVQFCRWCGGDGRDFISEQEFEASEEAAGEVQTALAAAVAEFVEAGK